MEVPLYFSQHLVLIDPWARTELGEIEGKTIYGYGMCNLDICSDLSRSKRGQLGIS